MSLEDQKVNVHGLKRPIKESKRFVVKDESNPDVEVVFMVMPPSIKKMVVAANLIEYNTELYVTGINGDKGSLPLLDGEVVEVTPETIEIACTIYALQQDAVYSVEEILSLMESMEMGMLGLIGYVKQVAEKFVEFVKNPTQAAITPQPSTITNEAEDTTN